MTLVMVGFGAMGSAMAARLGERGHDVIGVDPFLVAEGAAGTSAEGVPVVHSLAAVKGQGTRPSEVLVFVRLYEQVVAVLEELDADPWFDEVPVSVLSTLKPSDARALAERFASTRALTEAPVSGGVGGARNGTLTVLVAGAPGPWLADSSATVFRFDGYGLPTAAKLLNNALGAANAHALTATVEQAEGLGLDPAQFLDVVRVSSGGGWMADHFEDFPVDLLWKDFGLLHDDYSVAFPATTIDSDLLSAVATARQRTGSTPGNDAAER